MAANLTPQYHEAEARYRAAKTPEEKLAALEEMWRELPKHKSSEKLQADLKKKLSAARKEVQKGGKKGTSKVDPFAIARSGAGQVVLIGTPNTGKSSIVAALTKAPVKVADYPFASPLPVPGMVHYEDIQIQLIDTPPVTADHVPAGFPGLWRTADALLIVVDLAGESALEDLDACLGHLKERNVQLTDGPRVLPEEAGQPLKVPGLVLANKIDAPTATDNLAIIREFFGEKLRIEPFSTVDNNYLDRLPEMLFRIIRVVRVYAKPPGKKADMEDPFVLPSGSSVLDMAAKIFHGDSHKVGAARIWGHGVIDGQNVQLDHALHDRDVVELHT